MSIYELIGYVLPLLVSIWILITSVRAMNEDASLSVRGNFGVAMVAAAGFAVFPVLNIPTSIWLLYELKTHRRKPEKESANRERP